MTDAAAITLRDLFAANAPDDIPRHFMQRPMPSHLPGYRKGMNVSQTDELARQFDSNRMIAWRWHWADAMLAAREARNDAP
jgi:hypothetical protein